MAMPMSYNSLIGDMGSSLSSGQKQRVLLARALYRRPKILFLDEGTAHLDTEKEKEINANLRHLSMTRVRIAHRPEITHGADMILYLTAGAGPLQVAATSPGPAAEPSHHDGLTGFWAAGANSAPAAQGGDGKGGDHAVHARNDRYSEDGKEAASKHGSKGANYGGEPHKEDCETQKNHCDSRPPVNCGKEDRSRTAGETLAKIDFSRW